MVTLSPSRKFPRAIRQSAALFVLCSFFGFPATNTAVAQMRPDEVIAQSAQLLDETMAQAIARVPQSLVENASGVAIIPNVVKGSFIVGARRQRGPAGQRA